MKNLNPMVAATLVGFVIAAAAALLSHEQSGASGAELLIPAAVGFLMGFIASLIACLPGVIAEQRQHPSAGAISLCGWIGILLWPLWIVGIIWAHSRPRS